MPIKRSSSETMQRRDTAPRRYESKEMLEKWDAAKVSLPDIDAEFIRLTREKLQCSRQLFARRLFINERTLEGWEQGRFKPNAHAAVLLLLVRHFPDTLERLRRIANPDKQDLRKMLED